MKYILDTHTILWYCENPDKLSDSVKKIIYDDNLQIFVSIASLWEFSIKFSIGKLKFEGGLSRLCELIMQVDFMILPITQNHLATVINLPFIHRDPFDRLLIAAAIEENMTILTIDDNISQYDVISVW
ncbi:MAG: type II toxin-antitoxin system VapC family toxin [Lachnospiraceae bacterium]|nr:type II toxin-antitoxin system VapC family toxin [Lachnospiraceae bacterium]